MKKLITTLSLVVVMVGCTTNTATTNWINHVKHPIVVIKSDWKPDQSSHTYFLMDATGQTFIADQITAILPDTIK